ncbi:MAG TPA: hypothetical protein VJG48_01485 [Candidatus Paceibacterota bacterium]
MRFLNKLAGLAIGLAIGCLLLAGPSVALASSTVVDNPTTITEQAEGINVMWAEANNSATIAQALSNPAITQAITQAALKPDAATFNADMKKAEIKAARKQLVQWRMQGANTRGNSFGFSPGNAQIAWN